RAVRVPTGRQWGRLLEGRACRSARLSGRRGGRPVSCPTIAGNQHPAPGVAEVVAAVRFALARPRNQARVGGLWLDAVAEPVGARRRARLQTQCLLAPGYQVALGVR